jgi:hypothetical protein
MSRIEGRSPNASGQMRTAGCAPAAGWMNAASHVPSGVLMVTLVSTTCCCAAASAPAAAAIPAATAIETKSRRVISSVFMAAPLRGTSYRTAYNFLVDLRAIGIGAALLMSIALCACVRGNGPTAGAAPTPGGCPCLDREFSLTVGAPATIQGEQLEIRVESVGPDSRCPVNVTCVWEGDAQVTIGLSRQAQAPGRLQLHTSQQFATEGTYLNYRVRLTALMPAPRDGNPIESGSYSATLVVSR